MKEKWLEINGFKYYFVSNMGRVKSIRYNKEKILKNCKNGNGYLKVTLYKNKKPHQISVHRLVAIAFLKPIKGLNFVNHIDGNKKNNVCANLEWCTHLHNMRHARKIGLNKTYGSNFKSAKLTEKEVIIILKLLNSKRFTTYEIAEIYCVSQSTIHQIDIGKTWKHVKIIQ